MPDREDANQVVSKAETALTKKNADGEVIELIERRYEKDEETGELLKRKEIVYEGEKAQERYEELEEEE